jgi:hypothetical protein
MAAFLSQRQVSQSTFKHLAEALALIGNRVLIV